MAKFKLKDIVKILPIADDPDKNYCGNSDTDYAGQIRFITDINSDYKGIILYITDLINSTDIVNDNDVEFAEYEMEIYMATNEEQELFNKLLGKKDKITKNVIEPRNNDGRKICFWCENPTKHILGFSNYYDICEKCGK